MMGAAARLLVDKSRVAVVIVVLVAGCATTPPPAPAPPPAPPPPSPAEPAPAPPPAPPSCPCDEQHREISRLRQELANKETELRDLRAQQRDQLKALQDSSRQAARARVKARRTATQAEAAAYIADVEVALQTTQSSNAGPSRTSLITVARTMLKSASDSYQKGDYSGAMDRAAQAQQLMAMVSDRRADMDSTAQASVETPFELPIPLRVKDESRLRREPQPNAKVVAVLKPSTSVTAIAYKGDWLRVEAGHGRSGWLYQGVFTE